MRIGVHVSVAGGYLNGLEYAESVGAEAFQFFAKSPRQWRGPAIDAGAAASFAAARCERTFGPVFTHTAYLLNLSTLDVVLLEKTVIALADELVRASLLGVDGVVTHVGNDPQGDPAAAARRAASVIRAARELAGEGAAEVRLLLENTAGGGTSFGCTFAQLALIIDAAALPAELLGVCLDTCHAFAYGMAMQSPEEWEALSAEIDHTVGLDRLALIHANDCMFERGSRRDRHAWIGDGLIGEDGFRAMLCCAGIEPLAVIMEMPGEKPEKDVINLERMMRLREECR